MTTRKALFLAAWIGLAAGSGYLLLHLFRLRFEGGDVYPEYSSLRSDPLGCMALFEGLSSLGGVSVDRNLRPLERLGRIGNAALLLLGWNPVGSLPRSIEAHVREGARLVIAFRPILDARELDSEPFWTEEEDENGEMAARLLKEKWLRLEDWGVRLKVEPLDRRDDLSLAARASRTGRSSPPGLPDDLPWHSAVCFTGLDPDWQVIYSRGNDPVLVERGLGAGSIVLSSDSYLFSNEALRKDRHPELVAWALGEIRSVLFDETHLGVSEEPGVAVLVRKYRLEGAVVAFLALAALFIWRSTASFPPRSQTDADAAGHWVEGRDSASGFVSLLRRSIPAREVLPTCFEEWQKSLPVLRGVAGERLERCREVLTAFQAAPPRQRDPARAYREIHHILNRRPPTEAPT